MGQGSRTLSAQPDTWDVSVVGVCYFSYHASPQSSQKIDLLAAGRTHRAAHAGRRTRSAGRAQRELPHRHLLPETRAGGPLVQLLLGAALPVPPPPPTHQPPPPARPPPPAPRPPSASAAHSLRADAVRNCLECATPFNAHKSPGTDGTAGSPDAAMHTVVQLRNTGPAEP